MPSIIVPTKPIPIGGLVPWKNMIRPVEAVHEHPVLGWLYTIREQQVGGALVMWTNITQAELVEQMDAFGKWKVGQPVVISRQHPAKIIARKWDFQRGTFNYHIAGIPNQPDLVMDQSRLAARITAVAQR